MVIIEESEGGMAMRKAGKKDTGKATNRKALWKAYEDLQKRADRAWEKLQNDVHQSANSDVIVRDNNELLLLLGECNYMARECMRLASKQKKKSR